MMARQYIGTMAGRLFVLLLVGVLTSAALALVFAAAQRKGDLGRIRVERMVDRVSDFLSVADRSEEPLTTELLTKGVNGIRPVSGREVFERDDTALAAGLAARIGTRVSAAQANPASCLLSDVDPPDVSPFECWVVATTLPSGAPITLQLRRRPQEDLYTPSPLIALLLVPGIAALAFLAARMAAEPLGELSRAAQSLGADLDRPPLREHGPQEVREAARAFNLMQAELKNSVIEKTQLLASITHDLQTPMTRLRLRLERVQDEALRSRLIDDVATMQELIREGLNYARRAQITEPFASVALDELLEVVVEDGTASTGKNVTLVQRCGCDIEARPRALQRCLANLLDNALKYGGSAEVSADVSHDTVRVAIRDRGPGIPQNKLESVFRPFVRLGTNSESAADGVGLGLTIAKLLAEKNDATLTLRNHENGGLEAELILKRGVTKLAA
jgi:signal transduction histidine kinase